MSAGRLFDVDRGRIDARGPSPDPSAPAGGELLAVARRVLSRGPDTWCVRTAAGGVEFVEGEQATRDRLAELAGIAGPAPLAHPAWCDPSLCARASGRLSGVHLSAPVVVEIHAAPFGVRAELSLIGFQHADGRELIHVNLSIVTDPPPGDEDAVMEPFEMPIAPGPALALARALQEIATVAEVSR